MEFVFGISDERPKKTDNNEHQWEDERITASSSHTYLQLMEKLCETSIKKRREYDNDYSIHEHLWNLKISSFENFMKPNAREDPMVMFEEIARLQRRAARRNHREEDDDSEDVSEGEDSDDSDVENENRYRPTVVIHCPGGEQLAQDNDFDDDELVSATEHLSATHLPQGTMVTVTYDYGSTTTLYLKVLSCRPSAVQALLTYFAPSEASETDIKKALDTVPAYKLPKDKQIDAFFPNLSKIIMGKYVPIIQLAEGETDVGGYINRDGIISSVILGKYACITTEKDVQFCAIEGRSGNDMMHCVAMEDVNEFLDTAEQAWMPRDENNDPDNLSRYRYECIMRHLVEANNDELYASYQKMIDEDEGFGPKHLLVKGNKDRKPSGFDFEKVFPLTYKMLTGDYFRWFELKKDVLRVIVGRGIGPHHRDYHKKQILKTWKCSFESFHDVLCAVEASWVWKGKTMTPNQFLKRHDKFVGPSNPSKNPPILGKEEECVKIADGNDLKKLVTALAVTQEDGINILYSGHDDGTLSKWNLDDNTQVWSKMIYQQNPEGRPDESISDDLWLRGTFGVAGIVIRPQKGSSTTSEHVIWTWSHAPEGYAEGNYEDRTPAKLSCWNKMGNLIKRLACDVGEDEEGEDAYPTISSVVFCDLNYECKDDANRWFPCIVVGMQCCTQAIDWKGDYTNFSLSRTQRESSEGNIRIFDESSGEELESWIENMCMIKSLAVVPKKYIISLSVADGPGFPEALILWDAYNPGFPLSRIDFCSAQYRSMPNERLDGVCGLSVHGKHIVIKERYGTRIAGAIISNDTNGEPFLKFNGYGEVNQFRDFDSCIGRAAKCGNYGAMANEAYSTVWLFKTSSCADHEDLDREKMGIMEARYSEEDEDSPHFHAGRKMSTGMVQFPRFGGNKPNRKRKKAEWMAFADEDRSDGLGNGGPVSLAMRGRFLISGYSNGRIVRAPLLPSEFELEDDGVSANHDSCTSDIPSDWHSPILALPDVTDNCVIT
jgi:hypothetical protein